MACVKRDFFHFWFENRFNRSIDLIKNQIMWNKKIYSSTTHTLTQTQNKIVKIRQKSSHVIRLFFFLVECYTFTHTHKTWPILSLQNVVLVFENEPLSFSKIQAIVCLCAYNIPGTVPIIRMFYMIILSNHVLTVGCFYFVWVFQNQKPLLVILSFFNSEMYDLNLIIIMMMMMRLG